MFRRLAPFAAVLLLAAALPSLAHAAGFVKELENALKRGGDSAKTTLVLHPAGGEEVVLTADDYESYEIHLDGELPVALEMYAGKGAKKHDIWINLSRCTYWRMDIEKIDKKWNYDFHFYY